jgi:hypothetical protein
MKLIRFSNKYITLLCLVIAFAFSSFSCAKNGTNDINTNMPAINGGKIIIRVNSRTFTASLVNNSTSRAFRQMLPMTIEMTDLNANEKYFDLPSSLPSQVVNPGNISNGDIMLYGSRTLVLFYQAFPTSYSYTKIAKVDNSEGFAAALGRGNVRVVFELEK